MVPFRLVSDFGLSGDQPSAVKELVEGLGRGERHQVLLGVTGSGKTFTIANVIQQVQRPALVIAHNKTLAGQLYGEFKEFFPENAASFFVSYYDYYQPEAYIPQSDTYIEKDSSINDEIDRLRHVATHSLLTRRDVIIVASVSCIFGLGPVESYAEMKVDIAQNENIGRDVLLRRLVNIQYSRNDIDFYRGTFRVRGDAVDIFPVYEDQRALRVVFWGDEIEEIHWIDPLRGVKLEKISEVSIYPGSHYVMPADALKSALVTIKEELRERLIELKKENRLLEAQRLEQRTMFDLEMLEQTGHCSGIENYSRHFSGRKAGESPPTLIDYLPHDAVVIIDESHQTNPQIRAMYRGDRSRKQNLVDYGFRLPSALDNRPLTYEEFDVRVASRIHVSATPAQLEVDASGGVIVEQVIRPTGLIDPEIEVRPAKYQVDDVIGTVKDTISSGNRVLVTTLTKRMAEDLTDYVLEQGIKARYLHSDVKTLERLKIIQELRVGEFDVLIGINLLREGLDIPEVALVAVLDADKEGFLRSETSLIQTIGRAARNAKGKVVMYADKMTAAIKNAVKETNRRRAIQLEYNKQHGITPRSIKKAVKDSLPTVAEEEPVYVKSVTSDKEMFDLVKKLEKEMFAAAEDLEFERAAKMRDQIKALKDWQLKTR
jgi:excinuclease ABC subunit B